jgi:hypothetical protein
MAKIRKILSRKHDSFDDITEEICKVLFPSEDELPPPGEARKGQVSAILRRYFSGAK